MEFSDTLDGQGGDFANSAAAFLPLLPTTPRKAKLTEIDGNFFLSPFHGIIPTFFENAKNGCKKTGNLFLISCLGVPLVMGYGY